MNGLRPVDGGLLQVRQLRHRVRRRDRREAGEVPGSGRVQQRGRLVRPEDLVAAVGAARQSLPDLG